MQQTQSPKAGERTRPFICPICKTEQGDFHRCSLPRERTQHTPGPTQGKYGKAVVVCSIDPEFTAWAVIRPFCGTRWFKTVDEAELACEEYNKREIPRGAEGSEHPLSKGDIVDVHNNTPSGKEITEGRATIVSPTLRAHRYNVRFHGDGHNMTYERFVMPEHQITA